MIYLLSLTGFAPKTTKYSIENLNNRGYLFSDFIKILVSFFVAVIFLNIFGKGFNILNKLAQKSCTEFQINNPKGMPG